jgi:general secretion pathway protein L
MRPAHEANVTIDPASFTSPNADAPRAAGVWTLAGDRLIIAEPGGPATMLVPTEQVRLLAIDLPLPNRARRLAALPFAIEDRIAEPIESVYLALGDAIAPGRYLVGVVRHEVMARWVEIADEGGLGHAAIIPDALALPQPGEGAWSVDLSGDRAVVRAGDGTGFAMPATLLAPAWTAANNPPATAYGAALPGEMMAGQGSLDLGVLAAPPLDLRQGIYARRRVAGASFWRRLGWIAAIGAAAHIVIAIGDTLMLRAIADRREADTRAVAALAAPGVNLGEDLAAGVAGLLPAGPAGAPQIFVPLVARVSGALDPLAGAINVRAMHFQSRTLTIDLDGGEAGLAARIEAALKSAGVAGRVTGGPDGSIRITANGA